MWVSFTPIPSALSTARGQHPRLFTVQRGAISQLWRPATLRHAPRPIRQPRGFGERPPQQELNLRVGAAQLVGCPAGERVVYGWVKSQQKRLAFDHYSSLTGRVFRC